MNLKEEREKEKKKKKSVCVRRLKWKLNTHPKTTHDQLNEENQHWPIISSSTPLARRRRTRLCLPVLVIESSDAVRSRCFPLLTDSPIEKHRSVCHTLPDTSEGRQSSYSVAVCRLPQANKYWLRGFLSASAVWIRDPRCPLFSLMSLAGFPKPRARGKLGGNLGLVNPLTLTQIRLVVWHNTFQPRPSSSSASSFCPFSPFRVFFFLFLIWFTGFSLFVSVPLFFFNSLLFHTGPHPPPPPPPTPTPHTPFIFSSDFFLLLSFFLLF